MREVTLYEIRQGQWDQGWQSENNYFTEMCSGSEAGSYLRLIDFCITQRAARGLRSAARWSRVFLNSALHLLPTSEGNLPEGRCKATWKREFKLPWR